MSEIRIPFVKLFTESKEILLPSILKELESVARSGHYILGDRVEAFEKRVAQFLDAKYVVGVNSGLDALVLSLRALGIGVGDEVITAPNSFLASAAAVSLVGAKPVFVDVAEDFNLDPGLIEKAITPKTKAILPVHLTGYPCQMDSILEICSKHGLHLIEDAAQAIGAEYKSKKVGTFGELGCFSLHPLKNLHGWGDGGFIATDSPELEKKLRLQRNHGLINRDESLFFSFNSRLDPVQAVVATAFLELLSEVNRKRRENAKWYRDALRGLEEQIKLPIEEEGHLGVYHVFQLRVTRREELRAFLLKQGIETKVHYPLPIHLQEAAKYLGYKRGDFPVAEKLSEEILSVPVRESLNAGDLKEISNSIHSFYSR